MKLCKHGNLMAACDSCDREYFLKKKHEQLQAMQLFLDGTNEDESSS